jgi:hypothetical protein
MREPVKQLFPPGQVARRYDPSPTLQYQVGNRALAALVCFKITRGIQTKSKTASRRNRHLRDDIGLKESEIKWNKTGFHSSQVCGSFKPLIVECMYE